MSYAFRPGTVGLALLALASMTAPAQASQRRIRATVTSSDGEPLAGVKVTATSPEQASYSRVLETDDKGEFKLVVMDPVATVVFELEREGYAPLVEQFRPLVGNNRLELALRPLAPGELLFAGPGAQKTREAFDRGIAASRAEDWATAREAFAEVAGQQPRMPQAWLNLATSEYNLGHYEEAIKNARKAQELGIEATLESMLNMLIADSHTMLGHRKDALEYEEKVAETNPEVAAKLAFNKAADLVNRGQDEQAVPFFREALEGLPELADAHYELGLALYRLGDKPSARLHLTRFTELEPSSPKIPIARTLLNEIDKE